MAQFICPDCGAEYFVTAKVALIQFFEKPGCLNCEKQKRILAGAGNELECVNY